MPMDLVFVLKWVKIVIGWVLYIFHLYALKIKRMKRNRICTYHWTSLLSIAHSLMLPGYGTFRRTFHSTLSGFIFVPNVLSFQSLQDKLFDWIGICVSCKRKQVFVIFSRRRRRRRQRYLFFKTKTNFDENWLQLGQCSLKGNKTSLTHPVVVKISLYVVLLAPQW